MKVALNLLGLPSVRQGGAGFYTEQLLGGLAARDDLSISVLCGEQVAGDLERLSSAARIHPAAPAPGGSLRKALRLAAAARNPMSYREADAVSARDLDGAEVIHYPLVQMSAPAHSAASVVTCLDLQHLAYPGFFSRQDRLIRAIRWHGSIKAADRVLVYSRFVRGQLVELLDVDPDRIDVAYLACNPRFFSPRHEPRRDLGDYFFYPASPLPAKNHRRLLEAFVHVRSDHPGVRLVLTGPVQHEWGPVRVGCEELGLADSVDFLGHVSLSELASLYRGARGLVFPSLFEGFGLPVLEAMASGCLVAASDASSLPEICGDCAVLFDPLEADSIENGMRRLLEIPESERRLAVERGRERAEGFTVEALVDGTLASYRAAAREARARK